VSFLNQLKSQANALQIQQSVDLQAVQALAAETERACKTVWLYIAELAKQLNVIAPDGPALSVDGKQPWPAMKLTDFRADSRKKTVRDDEVVDYIAMGWKIVPREGLPATGSVSVNFPPELERVEKRLAAGNVKFERKDVRHPEKNTLQAFRFEYETQARGNVTVRADHDKAQLLFRLANIHAFEVIHKAVPAQGISTELMDELAKMIVGHPNQFL
jgi:hypothetical protein